LSPYSTKRFLGWTMLVIEPYNWVCVSGLLVCLFACWVSCLPAYPLVSARYSILTSKEGRGRKVLWLPLIMCTFTVAQ
jgi:hypothetical protein